MSETKIEWTESTWNPVTGCTKISMGCANCYAECMDRIEHLRNTPATIKFLSMEPLLGPFDELDLRGIDWVIVGGESGPGARPMEESWVLDIKHTCEQQGVAFFFKQWGGINKKKSGRLLQNRTWDGMPEAALVIIG